MRSSIFDLEENRLKAEVQKRGAKRVLIQLPEGLKPEGPRVAEVIEKAGALAILSADPCYGACDLAMGEAEDLGADLIIHFGHSPYGNKPERVPILYVDAKAALNPKSAVESALSLLQPWRAIGLVTTVQHVDMLSWVREILLASGKRVVVGDAGRLRYAGQVIGCDYSNAYAATEDVDAFLFVGGGRFHAVGVALATSKPTVVADLYESRAYSVETEAQKIVRQRWASIQRSMETKRFGILIGSKTWQRHTKAALHVKEKLESKGKRTTLLAIREITPEALLEFPTLEAYVNTACPRISIDNASKFQKPVLTVNEALVVVGELKWEQLLKRGWFEN